MPGPSKRSWELNQKQIPEVMEGGKHTVEGQYVSLRWEGQGEGESLTSELLGVVCKLRPALLQSERVTTIRM